MKQIFKTIIFLFFLPVFLLKDTFASERSVIKKVLYFFLIIILFGSIWLSAYQEIASLFIQSLYNLGITDKLTEIQVSGTSMLPTIKDGSVIQLNNPKKYGLSRGDIISFKNQETGGLHYLKRIVGLENEEVSIKNGHVLINGKILEENYVLNNLPTFGNTFLVDCENNTVPKDHFLVLGDNRTVSMDSRIVGFVDKNDIDGVIKTSLPIKFLSSEKQKELLEINITAEKFLEKLNEKRIKDKAEKLVTYALLNDIAKTRAEEIRDNFDNWKNQSFSLEKLLQNKDYRYNLVHEFVTFGYLSQDDVVNQILDSSLEKDAFLSSKYTEVGIGIASKTNKECTFPIISVILSWPSTPTYDSNIVESWKKEIKTTGDLLTTLQKLVGSTKYNQQKVRDAITLIAKQQDIASRIYNKMQNREWLSEKDQQDINEYSNLVKESEAILKELSPG